MKIQASIPGAKFLFTPRPSCSTVRYWVSTCWIHMLDWEEQETMHKPISKEVAQGFLAIALKSKVSEAASCSQTFVLEFFREGIPLYSARWEPPQHCSQTGLGQTKAAMNRASKVHILV